MSGVNWGLGGGARRCFYLFLRDWSSSSDNPLDFWYHPHVMLVWGFAPLLGEIILVCIYHSRYYVAEGVRLYSQETWRVVTENKGVELVGKYIKNVVSSDICIITMFQLYRCPLAEVTFLIECKGLPWALSFYSLVLASFSGSIPVLHGARQWSRVGKMWDVLTTYCFVSMYSNHQPLTLCFRSLKLLATYMQAGK